MEAKTGRLQQSTVQPTELESLLDEAELLVRLCSPSSAPPGTPPQDRALQETKQPEAAAVLDVLELATMAELFVTGLNGMLDEQLLLQSEVLKLRLSRFDKPMFWCLVFQRNERSDAHLLR